MSLSYSPEETSSSDSLFRFSARTAAVSDVGKANIVDETSTSVDVSVIYSGIGPGSDRGANILGFNSGAGRAGREGGGEIVN